jgi:hypothetical protein
VFGYVLEQVTELGIETLEALKAFVQGLLDDQGNVPNPVLGERTWKVWCEYARAAEPNHPDLVENWLDLSADSRSYDASLNGVAAKKLIEWIEEQMAIDAVNANS